MLFAMQEHGRNNNMKRTRIQTKRGPKIKNHKAYTKRKLAELRKRYDNTKKKK